MATFGLIPSEQGNNYTGMLTRSIVFSAALLGFLIATGMTIASIIVPQWISYEGTIDHGNSLRYTYGLHHKCSNTNAPSESLSTSALNCVQFPRYQDCQGEQRYFCSMWRSVGFLISFAVVLEGMAIAAYAILLVGGKQRREQGWGALAMLTSLAAIVQAIGMALIAYLFENDERFFTGWYLDTSFGLCAASWAIQAICAILITIAALVLPSEGGYELIPDRPSWPEEEP